MVLAGSFLLCIPELSALHLEVFLVRNPPFQSTIRFPTPLKKDQILTVEEWSWT